MNCTTGCPHQQATLKPSRSLSRLFLSISRPGSNDDNPHLQLAGNRISYFQQNQLSHIIFHSAFAHQINLGKQHVENLNSPFRKIFRELSREEKFYGE